MKNAILEELVKRIQREQDAAELSRLQAERLEGGQRAFKLSEFDGHVAKGRALLDFSKFVRDL
jgi:hypothetical protein